MVLVTLCLSLRLSAIFCLLQGVQIACVALAAEDYLLVLKHSNSMLSPEVQHSMSEPNFFAERCALICWEERQFDTDSIEHCQLFYFKLHLASIYMIVWVLAPANYTNYADNILAPDFLHLRMS